MSIKVEDYCDHVHLEVCLHVAGATWPVTLTVPDLDPDTVALGVTVALKEYVDHPDMAEFVQGIIQRARVQAPVRALRTVN